MTYFSDGFLTWLDDHAQILDSQSGTFANQLLNRIAAEDVFRIGVPESLGGRGGDKSQVIEFLAELAGHSLTASFVAWGHRTFIENILSSENTYFRDTYLNDLFTGHLAGGTGLSNATKYLSNIEELNVSIIEENGQFYLEGTLPWVTNARADNFAAVFAADFQDRPEKSPIILAIPSSVGIQRSKDLEFISLQGANTAALTFNKLPLDERWILSKDAKNFLAQTRPEFLGYQFGLATGLAQASLSEVETSLSSNRSVLTHEFETTKQQLENIKKAVFEGINQTNYFVQHPRELFQLRIDIVDIVANSLLLELQASGGRGYFKHSPSAFARRWNEGAFLPIVSPSAVQLRHILAQS
ncbi:Acyl-CoA dehydrogenase [Streptococcus henryi]|uniref:Acyl-CoA dehydrogenase n=1 Tax=Streptococcus henryi TaxID=439219 RepID=A0A1G6B8N9_9STRE|nr:acyl-CoA dehydrogenase family protein [Streptococcus henryi]SDB17008.1 Acyl-CoA dehydrogenase [Streptococcus henryi]